MIAALATIAVMAAPRAGAVTIDARVQGLFTMTARVTAAVNVPGEHRGQLLRRNWRLTPLNCGHSGCRRLELDRQRGGNRHSQLMLQRTGPGRYSGRGAFYVALSCNGRVFNYGSRAPYSITLEVTDVKQIGGKLFALGISAVYRNTSRSDATPCPLGPAHDAARYTGRGRSRLPVAPVVSYTAALAPGSNLVSFTDTSTRGPRGARVVSRVWGFDDPVSGAADSSKLPDPQHLFTNPGVYLVTLTETDAAGLRSAVTKQITIPSGVMTTPTSTTPGPALRPGAARAGVPAGSPRRGSRSAARS
jgi:hypothetical protein